MCVFPVCEKICSSCNVKPYCSWVIFQKCGFFTAAQMCVRKNVGERSLCSKLKCSCSAWTLASTHHTQHTAHTHTTHIHSALFMWKLGNSFFPVFYLLLNINNILFLLCIFSFFVLHKHGNGVVTVGISVIVEIHGVIHLNFIFVLYLNSFYICEYICDSCFFLSVTSHSNLFLTQGQ